MNQWLIIGYTGKKPEGKDINGKRLATVSIAVERFGQKSDGSQKDPIWVHVQAWEKKAEVLEKYVDKGQQIAVAGRLDIDEWNDQNTGERRHKVIIHANEIRLLGKKDDKQNGGAGVDSNSMPGGGYGVQTPEELMGGTVIGGGSTPF